MAASGLVTFGVEEFTGSYPKYEGVCPYSRMYYEW